MAYHSTHKPVFASLFASFFASLPSIVMLTTLLALLLSAGCGVPFATVTPQGFVELKDQEPDYDYRAVNTDGLVIAVRAIKHDPKGDADFWVAAIRKQVREMNGYALLDEKKISTRSGLKGTRLMFGHDESGESMRYDVAVFVTDDHIFLVEFGGTKDEMTRQEPRLDSVLQTFAKK